MNQDYATKHNIRVVKSFVDDGYSAKNFDRPQWRQLEKELAKHKNQIDYLIITKYDRLIRNAAEGLAFIEKLEQKWNIKLLSVMENFFIDPHSPFFFKTRADLLVTAEFERRVISDRSKFGMWSAKTQGRYLGKAPLGYDNAKDEKDKPIIVVNENERPVIEQVFDDFLQGLTYPVIKKRVNSKGFSLKGHDGVKRIILNYTYAGLIQTPSYKDEVSKVIKGIHEPIIPEDTFWKAYYKLQEQMQPQGPKSIDDQIPLRGYILCQKCGGLHTGGKSKGRSGYYYYYRCKKCNGENYRADYVHEEMAKILQSLSLEDRIIKAIYAEAEIELGRELKDRHHQLKKAEADYEAINQKLSSLEEKYIANAVSAATYEKWYPVYSAEIKKKKMQVNELKKDDNDTLKLFKEVLPYLTDLGWIYNKADVVNKQALLKGIFWGGFTKEKVGGRTAFLNPIFLPKVASLEGLLRIEKTGKPENLTGFPVSTQDGT